MKYAVSNYVRAGLLGALLLGAGAFVAKHTQKKADSELANRVLRVECVSVSAASDAASEYATRFPGHVVLAVAGTGSMSPFIPAARKGDDPRKVVAFACVVSAKKFSSVEIGDLVVYRAEWLPGSLVVHQVVDTDKYGLILSGLNNARTESSYRVTEKNFVGIVGAVFVSP